MKNLISQNVIRACAIGLGMGISFFLPLATYGGEIIKGGPQMMIRSQVQTPAAERKADTKTTVVSVCQSCCSQAVANVASTKVVEKK